MRSSRPSLFKSLTATDCGWNPVEYDASLAKEPSS